MSVSRDISAFKLDTEIGLDRFVRAVTLEFFSRVVLRTPVGNPDLWETSSAGPGYVGGRLRGNWQASVKSPVSGVVDTKDADGSATNGKIRSSIGGAGEVSFLTNNLPYVYRIEMERWSRKQAPKGMVRVSLAEINQILRRQLDAIR